MQVTVSRKDLLPPLRLLRRMARGKDPAPVTLHARGTQGVALRLFLTAAQDRIGGQFEVPATIGKSSKETAIVDCRRLTRLVEACRYPHLCFSTVAPAEGEARSLQVDAGPITLTLPPIEGAPFYRPPRAGRQFYIEAGTLRNGLRAVLPAASEEEKRAVLTTILLQYRADEMHPRLIATDSYRLHTYCLPRVERPWGVNWEIVLPRRFAQMLCQALAKVPVSNCVVVTCSIARKQPPGLRVRWDTGEISCEGIECQYPRWQRVWPPLNQAKMILTRESEDLRAVLRLLAEIMEQEEGTPKVLLLPQANRLHLIGAGTHAEIRATLRVRKGAEPFAIAFHPGYLMDALAGASGAREIRFFSQLGVIHIRDAERGPLEAVVMPMQINDDEEAALRKAAGAA